MITVIEIWHLKPDKKNQALMLMQEMDDIVGPPAHKDSGWCGHAHFYQRTEHPNEVIMMYPWRSRELHEALIMQEETILASFIEENCTGPREITYYNELPVEVEHNDA